MRAEALPSDTKADLLSSALPPVVAEALQPNEEVASSGRQMIVRPACTYRVREGVALLCEYLSSQNTQTTPARHSVTVNNTIVTRP